MKKIPDDELLLAEMIAYAEDNQLGFIAYTQYNSEHTEYCAYGLLKVMGMVDELSEYFPYPGLSAGNDVSDRNIEGPYYDLGYTYRCYHLEDKA